MSREDDIAAVWRCIDAHAQTATEATEMNIHAAITRALLQERKRTLEAVGCLYVDESCEEWNTRSQHVVQCARCRMLAEVQAELGDEKGQE